MNSLLKKAEKARQSSQFKQARVIYQTILRRPLVGLDEKVEAFLGLADMERIQGLFSQAIRHYEQGARLSKKQGGERNWDARVGWALAARAFGRPREAMAVLKKTMAFYRKKKDLPGLAFAHWALGGTLRITGEMKEGLKELQAALALFKKLRDSEGVSYTCCALGGIFRMLGHYAQSGKYYREANHRMRLRQDTFGTAYSYCGLGNVERMAGRFKQALLFYRKAEKLYATIGDRVSYAYTLWSIGTTYKMLGLYARARQAFQKADKLFKKTGDTRGRIYTLLGFSEVEWLCGKSRKYLFRYFKSAEDIAKSNDFGWEKLHVKTFLNLVFQVTFKKMVDLDLGKDFETRKKTLKTALEKHARSIALPYQKAGSIFHPASLPVNWP